MKFLKTHAPLDGVKESTCIAKERCVMSSLPNIAVVLPNDAAVS